MFLTFCFEHSALILRCLGLVFLAAGSLLWAEYVGRPPPK